MEFIKEKTKIHIYGVKATMGARSLDRSDHVSSKIQPVIFMNKVEEPHLL